MFLEKGQLSLPESQSAVREVRGNFAFAKIVVRLLWLKGPEFQTSKHYSMGAETLVQILVLALVSSPSWGKLLISWSLKILNSKIVVSANRVVVHTPGAHSHPRGSE